MKGYSRLLDCLAISSLILGLATSMGMVFIQFVLINGGNIGSDVAAGAPDHNMIELFGAIIVTALQAFTIGWFLARR